MSSDSPKRRIRRWRRWGLEAAVIVAVFSGMQIWLSRGSVSGEAPFLAGYGPDGVPVNGTGVSDGSPRIVHFWATWCGICGAMDDNISMLARHHNVTTVALKSAPGEDVSAHMRERDLEFPVIMDNDGRQAARWGVRGVPTTFFVSGDGQIEHVTIGYSTRLGLLARSWWFALTADS